MTFLYIIIGIVIFIVLIFVFGGSNDKKSTTAVATKEKPFKSTILTQQHVESKLQFYRTLSQERLKEELQKSLNSLIFETIKLEVCCDSFTNIKDSNEKDYTVIKDNSIYIHYICTKIAKVTYKERNYIYNILLIKFKDDWDNKKNNRNSGWLQGWLWLNILFITTLVPNILSLYRIIFTIHNQLIISNRLFSNEELLHIGWQVKKIIIAASRIAHPTMLDSGGVHWELLYMLSDKYLP